jgi:hypothetical protein
MTKKINRVKTYELITYTPRNEGTYNPDNNLLVAEVYHYEGVYKLYLAPAYKMSGNQIGNDLTNSFMRNLELGRYSAKKINELADKFLTFEKVQEVSNYSKQRYQIKEGGTQ